MCQPSRFRVKKAGMFFNIAPVNLRHFPWHHMHLKGKKPVFAAILGVVRSGKLFSFVTRFQKTWYRAGGRHQPKKQSTDLLKLRVI